MVHKQRHHTAKMPWFQIAFFLGAINTQSFAQDWRSLGLENERIEVITVDWSDPDVIYAGSGSDFSAGAVGGIFKSSDRGAAWDTLLQGVTVRDIDIHPKDANIIYATLGANALTFPDIAKSSDGGKTWFSSSSGIRMSSEEGPLELVIDPLHPDTLYTGTAGFFGGAPYKSTDGGLSWLRIDPDTNWVWSSDSILVDPLQDGITSITMDPADTEHLYFGTADTGFLLETIDGGKTWNTTGLTEKGIIFDIEIDPFQTEHIYAGTSDYGILRSIDGGHSWSNMNQNITGDHISVPKVQFYPHDETLDVYIIANWENGTGIYFFDTNQQWRKIGIDDRPVQTITIFEQDMYAGRFGENLGGVYTLDLVISVEESNDTVPKDFGLNVFPNPAYATITIAYQLPQTTPVRLEIFDILGRRQELLLQDRRSPGEHTQAVNLSSLPTGVYFLRMTAGRWVMSKKIILLK